MTSKTSTAARVALAALVATSVSMLSAHVVPGRISPALARAHVSSPSVGIDSPVAVKWGAGDMLVDTGMRIVCFYVANSSPPRVDYPEWPRVTSVGFELPGSPTGFTLLEASSGDWDLVERTKAFVPDGGVVQLDFALVARRHRGNPSPRRRANEPRGIEPGQPEGLRRVGTRFCVTGPFADQLPNIETPDIPDDTQDTTIERLLNGVVVAFEGVYGNPAGRDVGVWNNAQQRVFPLYPRTE